MLNKPKYKFISPRKERRKAKKENKPIFKPAISVRFSEILREAFIEKCFFPRSVFIIFLYLTIRRTGMDLTCDFPQLLQAYGRLISNTLYLGLPIYFTLRPTFISESLKNLNIEKFEVLTAVLMKSQVFLHCFP
jgi:hypothetical protein